MRFSINEPFVLFERFETEVVAVQIESGAYHSMSAVAADIFHLLAARPSIDEIVEALTERYEGRREDIDRDVRGFLEELRQHSLAVAKEGQLATGEARLPSGAAGTPWQAPTINVYTDLQELFLMDPVHDVGAEGWPAPKPAGVAANARFRVPATGVIFERFDDETVAMNLATGSYHSLSGPAEDVYLLLGDEPNLDEIVAALRSKYPWSDTLPKEVGALLAELRTAGLAEADEQPQDGPVRTIALAKPGSEVVWSTPKLDMFLDQAPAQSSAFLASSQTVGIQLAQQRRYRFACDVHSASVKGGGLAVASSKGTYYRLNSSAAEAFRLLQWNPTASELCRALADRYDCDPRTITAATVVLLRHLQTVELVSWEDAAVGVLTEIPEFRGPKQQLDTFAVETHRDLHDLFIYYPSTAAAPAKKRTREFVSAMEEYFGQAAGGADTGFSFEAAGRAISVRCAGSDFRDQLSKAFAHLPKPLAGADLTIHVWSADSVASKRPVIAAFLPKLYANWVECCGPRGEVVGFHTPETPVLYHPGPDLLSVFDSASGNAWVLKKDRTPLPYWEVGSPFRTVLHQYLSTVGNQFVHCAAVGRHGYGVLLAGKGGSGKSTTALVCLEKGWQYAGDDYACVSLNGEATAHSLYNTAKLKGAEDVAKFPRLSGVAFNQTGPDPKATFFLSDVWPQQMVNSLSVTALLVPRITGGLDTQLSPCTPADALLALAPSTLAQLPTSGAQDLDRLAAIVEQAPCFYLNLGTDLTRIAPVIESALGVTGGDYMTLSVIIPAYNTAKYIGEAIQSVVNQRFPPAEILVVDNGSTDQTAEAAQRSSPLVRVIEEKERGAAHARNAGVQASRGDVLAFLDADDLWMPDKMALQVPELQHADMVVGRMRNFFSPEVPEIVRQASTAPLNVVDGFNPGAVVIRRETFFRVGMWPAISIGEAIAWFGMARAIGVSCASVESVVVERRLHANNTTRRLDLSGYAKAAKMVLDRRRSAVAG